MTPTHIPAHTTFSPDRFIDEEAGREYIVRQDTDAQDPRGNFTVQEAALWAFKEPALHASVAAEQPEGNLAIDAFARFYEHFSSDKALEATRRYLAVFHPEAKMNIETRTIRGDSQGDWLDVVAATAEGFSTPEALIDEFRMWAFGRVWVVIPDGKPGLCNIYADGPDEAVKHYRENYEDPVFIHTIELKVHAPDAARSRAKIEEIVAAIHESDALPMNVTVRSFSEAKIER